MNEENEPIKVVCHTIDNAVRGLILPHEDLLFPRMQRPHKHAELEINLVTQGTASYLLVDKSRYELRANSLVFLFPAQEHILLSSSDNYRGWVMYLHPSIVERFSRSDTSKILLDPDPPGQYIRHLPDDVGVSLSSLFRHVSTLQEAPELYESGLGYALLSAWHAYSTATEHPYGTAIHPAIDMAVRLMHEESEDLGIDQLARRVGLSVSYFSRLFGHEVGMSLSDFRNKLRLNRFLRRFDESQCPNVLQLALEAGFGSYAQFYQVFRRRMGCGPANYKKGRDLNNPSSSANINSSPHQKT